ncbi:MAG: ATP-binding protein, partial [Acidimicrobiales bacterium]
MLAFVSSASLLGVEGHRVTVEVHASSGLPSYTIVGLPDASCRESRDRVRAALLSSEQQWPQCRLTVNLAPTGLPKAGAGLDLAIAIGILAATDKLPSERLVDHAFIGELGLDGSIRAVAGALPLVGALDCATVVVPMLCLDEARVVGRCQVIGARTLRDVIDALTDLAPWPAQPPPVATAEAHALPDLREVRGQPLARKALEVAAAGGHHLLMVGPPGAGKTMLARRLPGLLPRLDAGQSIEVSCIHSAAGLPLPDRGLVSSPPFRAPHHSASTVSLVGGGTLSLRPGEISIAQESVTVCFMSDKATTTAIYCRISRDTEGLGLGVSRQELASRDLADKRGLAVVDVFTDNDISATRGKRRPGFEAMLTAATEGAFDTIIAWHVDRITRNPR